jgi:thiazole synthase ThiGH ThiG subunit
MLLSQSILIFIYYPISGAHAKSFLRRNWQEKLETNWLKLEIHPDPKYLMPDAIETLKNDRLLGFIVLPYTLILFYANI